MKRNLIILLVIPILLISCGSDNYKDFMQNTLSENFKNTMCSFKAMKGSVVFATLPDLYNLPEGNDDR